MPRKVITPAKTRQLNVSHFRTLYDAVQECTTPPPSKANPHPQHNDSLAARLVGVTRKTWIQWQHTHPPLQQWGWNLTLTQVVEDYIVQLSPIKKKHRRKRQELQRILHRLAIDTHALDIAAQAHTDAELHLLKAIYTSPKGYVLYSDLILPANSGGFSASGLTRAASSIGVVKVKKGFGDEADSRWYMPNTLPAKESK